MLKLYPFLAFNILTRKHKYDKDGVPLTFIMGKWHHHPVSIAQYALMSFNLWNYVGLEEYRRCFMRCVKWFRDNVTFRGDLAVWFYTFDWPSYGLKAPWISGMAQGMIASTFLRAFYLTEDERYLRLAESAVKTMLTPIERGGTLISDEMGIWIEEVITKPPAHILNGFIFALVGIYEYSIVTGEKRAIFQELVRSLKRNIKAYDIGYWSLYDLKYRRPAPITYHLLHIEQLNWLYVITHQDIFKSISRKWLKEVNRTMPLIRLAMERLRHKIMSSP